MNPWLKLSKARKIAAELQVKYCGQPSREGLPDIHPLEDEILVDLWNHPDYTEDMWLNAHWDDFGCLIWLQIGTAQDCVPR